MISGKIGGTFKKAKVCWCQNGESAGKSQEVTFRKSQKLLADELHERQPIQNIQ